mmetsp:Transcript_68069/g.192871  ORF Transcript_68069/g.192871 Transcript_68069/m.192871 type:complete len:215 (+) Transcript_68069:236-880(+)
MLAWLVVPREALLPLEPPAVAAGRSTKPPLPSMVRTMDPSGSLVSPARALAQGLSCFQMHVRMATRSVSTAKALPMATHETSVRPRAVSSTQKVRSSLGSMPSTQRSHWPRVPAESGAQGVQLLPAPAGSWPSGQARQVPEAPPTSRPEQRKHSPASQAKSRPWPAGQGQLSGNSSSPRTSTAPTPSPLAARRAATAAPRAATALAFMAWSRSR